MKNRFIKAVALALCLCMLVPMTLSGCATKGTTLLSLDKYTISENIYQLMLTQQKGKMAYAINSEYGNYNSEQFWGMTIDMATQMMRIVAPGYIAFAVTQSLSGVMRGAGDTTTPMWISFFTTLVVRVPLAYLLAYLTRSAENPNGDPRVIFFSLLCSWTVGCIINVLAYRRGKWRTKAKMKRVEE